MNIHAYPYISIHRDVNNVATAIETGFNLTGTIPIVGIFSGVLRLVAGKTQAVAGLLFFGIGVIGGLVASSCLARHRFQVMRHLGAEHFNHGVANMVRGIAEVIAGVSFGGLGSLLMLIPNLAQDNAFSPCYKYQFVGQRVTG
ncbi:MAG: hypothetical protein ACHQUC_07040 [Chlamydiales bacterium]